MIWQSNYTATVKSGFAENLEGGCALGVAGPVALAKCGLPGESASMKTLSRLQFSRSKEKGGKNKKEINSTASRWLPHQALTLE